MSKRVLVLIIGYNGGVPLNWCVHSIADQIYPEQDLDIVVWDNGGLSKESLFKNFPNSRGNRHNFIYHLSEDNMLWSPGINAAKAKYFDGHDFVLVLNQDVEFPAHAIQRLVDDIEALPEHAGAIAPAGSGIGGMQDYTSYYMLPDDISGEQLDIKERESQRAQYLIGTAILYKSEVFDKIGHHDEKMPLSGDDFDFAIRMKEAGYSLWVAYNVFINHVCHSTGDSQNWEEFGAASWKQFDRKYDGYYKDEEEAVKGLWNTVYDPDFPIGTGISKEEKIKRGIVNG